MNNFNNNLFDPTKVSYLVPPEWQINFKKSYIFEWQKFDPSIEILISLICNWILNVSQVVMTDEYEVTSIPINPEKVEEKLSYQEVLADIVLYQLLSEEYDRDLLLSSEQVSWSKIWFHNCNIFERSYSIFDIYDFWPKVYEKDVFKLIFEIIRSLYNNEFLDDIELFNNIFISPEENDSISIWKHGFFERMLLKVNEFLERYDNEEWKTFFLRQVAKSLNFKNMPSDFKEEKDIWYDKDLERYNNLVFSLKNIKSVISWSDIKNKALEYLGSDIDFINKDLKKHILKVKELSKKLKSLKKNNL